MKAVESAGSFESFLRRFVRILLGLAFVATAPLSRGADVYLSTLDDPSEGVTDVEGIGQEFTTDSHPYYFRGVSLHISFDGAPGIFQGGIYTADENGYPSVALLNLYAFYDGASPGGSLLSFVPADDSFLLEANTTYVFATYDSNLLEYSISSSPVEMGFKTLPEHPWTIQQPMINMVNGSWEHWPEAYLTFSIEAEPAIPEPSSVVLLIGAGFSLIGFAFRRHLQRQG